MGTTCGQFSRMKLNEVEDDASEVGSVMASPSVSSTRKRGLDSVESSGVRSTRSSARISSTKPIKLSMTEEELDED